MNLSDYHIDKSWTLFLDRDGVINERLVDDYVKTWQEFEFLPGVKEALAKLAKIFGRIIIVSNQQGIGKGLMTEQDLEYIHAEMLAEIEEASGRLDAIYFCPELKENDPECRKPNPGMAYQAQQDFPEIDFGKSLMVGDSESDMAFGKRLGMQCVFIGAREKNTKHNSILHFKSLKDLSSFLSFA